MAAAEVMAARVAAVETVGWVASEVVEARMEEEKARVEEVSLRFLLRTSNT